MKLCDIRTLVFSILCLLCYVMQWFYLNKINILIIFVTSLQVFQQLVIIHNFAHCPIFKSKTLNSMYGIMLTLLSGAPASLFIPGHNESHHKHLETDKDMTRTTKMTYKYETLNLILFFPTVIFDVIQNDTNFMMKQFKQRNLIFFQFFLEFVILHLFFIKMTLVNFYKFFFVYILPTLFGKYMIITLNILQHRWCKPDTKFEHSRNFTGSILNFLLLNNGYHTLHHNNPGLHWSLLKEKHKKYENMIPEYLIYDNIIYYIIKDYFYKDLQLIAS